MSYTVNPTHSLPPRSQRVLRQSPHRIDLIATDFFLINLAFFLASLYTYGYLNYASLPGRNLVLIFYVNFAWSLITVFGEAYRWYERVRMEHRIRQVVKLICFLLAANSIFYYNILGEAPYNPFFLLAHFLSLAFVVTGRIVLRLREKSPFQQFNYVIVGGQANNLSLLLKTFDYCFPNSANLVGRFGNTEHEGIPNIGTYTDIKHYLASDPPIDKLVFFYSKLSEKEMEEIIAMCNARMIDLEVAPREATLFTRGYKAQQLGDMTILTSREEPLSHLRNKWAKRIFDIVFSSLVILCVFPVMIPIIGLLIYLEDPGPIFFRQKRSGYRNKTFKMWKFRSMRVNKECDELQATKDDNRTTKIGAFLRKTSLDEFPQFINVFMGDMSVVGPRPHMLSHTEKYAEVIDAYMIRHKVKPGVTGLAQVNGYRGPTEELWKMEKRVEYDVYYLENWSLLMDLKCIFKTVTDGFKKDPNRL